MSIELIANAGLTLLQTAQYRSQINSSNMANARTAGYSVKSVSQVSTVSNGTTIGVDTTKISGVIDRQLQKRLDGVLSGLHFKSTMSDHLKELTSFFGKLTDSNSTLSAKLSAFEAKLVVLKNQPNKSENALHAVRALENVVNQIKNISKDIQGLRSRISQDIETTVNFVNTGLKQVETLNKEISVLNAQGKATADLEDKRREVLKSLSSQIDVSFFINAENKAVVTTAKGTQLVGSTATSLKYQSPAALSRTAKHPGGIPAITVNGKDITNEIKGSKLGALIQLRDNDSVKKQSEVDELALQFKNRMNKISTQGASFPLQQTITGDVKLANSTALSLTGTAQIILSDKDGKAKSIQNLNMAGISSVGDLVTHLNGLSGITASLNADGELSIKASNSNERIILNPANTATTANPSENLSQVLGINTLITGSNSAELGVNKNISSNPMTFPKGMGTLKTGTTVGKNVITANDSTNLTALIDALKSSIFKPAGDMTASTQSFANYSANMLSILAEKSARTQSEANIAQKVVNGVKQDIASKSGVNMDEEVAKLAANQKAFQVAGHIMKASQDMFNVLLQMARR